MSWSADGSVVAAPDADTGAVVALHDPRTGRRRAAVSLPDPATVIALSPDGRWLATGHGSGVVDVRRVVAAGEPQPFRRLTHAVGAVCWSPDGKRLATGGRDGFVRLWDVAEAQLYATLERQDGRVIWLAWSPAGNRLAVTALSDPAVTFWAADTGRRIVWSPAGQEITGPVAWSSDGRRVATGSRGARVLVWETATGVVIATLTDHSRQLTGIAWSGDG